MQDFTVSQSLRVRRDIARLQNDHTAITMSEAVTESENLTVNEIVRAKEIFEREITEHYIAEAEEQMKNNL